MMIYARNYAYKYILINLTHSLGILNGFKIKLIFYETRSSFFLHAAK